VGLTVSVAGLLMAPWTRRPGVPLSAGLMVLVFPVVYFWFVANQSSLIYGRYLLPIGPMLAIGLAIGLVAIASLAARLAPRVAPAALPVLVAVLIGPMFLAAASWSAGHARPVTLDQVARWVATRPAAGQRVVIEGAAFNVPPRVSLARVNRLIDKSLDMYRAEGVAYLVATSDITATYANDPQAMAAHQNLLAATDRVQTFAPNASRTGATLTILQIKP
jgi:hypothetical protein